MFIRIDVVKNLCFLVLLSFTCGSAAWTSDLERDFWSIASKSNSFETLTTFLETFPESAHSEEARSLVIGLEDDKRRREFEDSIFATVGQVTYDAPMNFGNRAIIGQSLASISALTPQHSPVEGLPESYWKDQECSGCHQWTRAELCTQASTYIEKKPLEYQSKKHPFDGLLKINMRNWAMGGCE